MAAETPLCQYPPCRAAGRHMTLLGEGEDHYVFGCWVCGCARVITKPRTREAAAYAISMQRRSAAAQHEHALQPHRRYVFLGGS